MGHIAVSSIEASLLTLQNWQHVAKDNFCNFATFNSVVDTKASIIQMGPNILHVNLNRFFLFSQNIVADLKGPKVKYNLHYG